MVDETIEYGVIKVYFPLKGYGFITRDKGRDVFFHRKDIGDEVWALEGVRVQFHVQKSEGRSRALQIQKLG